MKVAVLGANGRSGKAFVEHVLLKGYSINAGIRSVNTLYNLNGLSVFQCDATNEDEVTHLIEGCDAVVSLIGHVKGSEPDVQTVAIKNIINCMEKTGVKRLISLTGNGVIIPGDEVRIIDKILTKSISIIDPARVQDGINHVEIVKNSSCDWSILRVAKLSQNNSIAYTLTPHGPAKTLVSRHEVALAITELLENYSYVNEMPIISKI